MQWWSSFSLTIVWKISVAATVAGDDVYIVVLISPGLESDWIAAMIKSINVSKLRTWYTFSRTRGPSRRLSPPSHPLWRRRQWSNASPSPASDNWGQTISNNDETINYIWLTSSLTRLSSVLRASSSCSLPRWARAPPVSSPGASSWCSQWSDQAVSSRAAGQHQNPFHPADVQDLYSCFMW